MPYQKNQQNNFIVLKLFFGMIILSGLAVIAYLVWSNQSNVAVNTKPEQSSEGGKVAQLGDTNQFVAGASTETPSQQTQIQETTTYSTEPFVMNLPAGWTTNGAQDSQNPCDPDQTQIITTYTNGSKTIEVFQNGSPTGCDGSTIGDVYYEYEFTTNDSALAIETGQSPVFCTKQDNPTCPKGDGKVTVFVGNKDAVEPNNFVKNSVTNNTYFFVMTDTSLSSDLNAQAATLASLAESITIK